MLLKVTVIKIEHGDNEKYKHLISLFMPKSSPHKDVWESIYAERFMTLWSPPEAVVQFVGRFLKKRLTVLSYQESFPAKRILDLGCGNGATVAFLSKLGYEVHGIDLSEVAIKLGREHLAKEGLHGELLSGDASSLPYPDNFFDVIICYGVIDHMEPDRGLAIASEVHRVLRNSGLFFVTLADTRSKKYGQGVRTAKNTYLLEGDWYEAGAVQHYFDRQDIDDLIRKKFHIKDIRLIMQEKLSVNFEPLEWTYRWHLTLEK